MRIQTMRIQTIGGNMNQSFHYLLMINQALFQKKVFYGLVETGLTSGQPKVLDYLSLHDGSIQKDIAFGCQIDPATLTGILKIMEEKGLVERRTLNGNQRSSYVYLTDLGKEKAEKVAETFLAIETEVFHGIEKNEREKFMNIFYKICSNMIDMERLQ